MNSPQTRGASTKTTLGYGLALLGLVAGLGGIATRPTHGWTYAIGGLIVTTIGVSMIQRRPAWGLLAMIWVTVAVVSAYLVVTLRSQLYLLTVSMLVIIIIGAVTSRYVSRQ